MGTTVEITTFLNSQIPAPRIRRPSRQAERSKIPLPFKRGSNPAPDNRDHRSNFNHISVCDGAYHERKAGGDWISIIVCFFLLPAGVEPGSGLRRQPKSAYGGTRAPREHSNPTPAKRHYTTICNSISVCNERTIKIKKSRKYNQPVPFLTYKPDPAIFFHRKTNVLSLYLSGKLSVWKVWKK